jgi:hypothetical protein
VQFPGIEQLKNYSQFQNGVVPYTVTSINI